MDFTNMFLCQASTSKAEPHGVEKDDYQATKHAIQKRRRFIYIFNKKNPMLVIVYNVNHQCPYTNKVTFCK